MLDNIRMDIIRARQKNHAGQKGVLGFFAPFTHAGTLAVLFYRFGHFAYILPVPVIKHLLLMIYYPLKFIFSFITGINIPTAAKIGPGLVVHTWGGVYLPCCTIGRNVYFQHGVVVSYGCKGIGDNVYFGPGAKIIRNVRIGSRVKIGANAVVMTDIPDDCTAVGVPARIVKAKKPFLPS